MEELILGELTERKIGYGIVQPGEPTIGGVPVIKVNNIISGLKSIQDLDTTHPENDQKYRKTRLNGGEIIISVVGTIGKTAIVPMDFKGCNLVRATALIDIKDPILSRWVKYYIDSPKGQSYINGNLNTTVQPTLNIKSLVEMPIPFYGREYAEKVVAILSRIDDKIENNRQINDNLEQQIQTLYREWFIDNPKTEWATIALSEVATFVSGYSYKGNELVDSSETAMATIKNFERNGGFKLDGYKPVSPSSKLKEEQHAELFDILVAHTDLTQNAEVIGNAEIILSKDSYSDVIFSMDLVKVVAKESFPYQFLLALLLKNPVFKSHCIGYVNGTTVLHLNKRALPDFNTQIPTCEDAVRMNEIAKSIFIKMSENLSEIANLTKLRDSLLPKLMSGELKINEIDC